MLLKEIWGNYGEFAFGELMQYFLKNDMKINPAKFYLLTNPSNELKLCRNHNFLNNTKWRKLFVVKIDKKLIFDTFNNMCKKAAGMFLNYPE